MTRQRRSSTGDIPILMPEGKVPRRPPGRSRWLLVAVILAVLVAVLWRVLVMKRP